MVCLLHGLVGILHEVEEGLLAQAFVERNERQSACVVPFDTNRFARLLCARSLFASKTIRDNLQDPIEKRDQVRGMRFGVKRASEVQKLGDEITEPIDFGRNVS